MKIIILIKLINQQFNLKFNLKTFTIRMIMSNSLWKKIINANNKIINLQIKIN